MGTRRVRVCAGREVSANASRQHDMCGIGQQTGEQLLRHRKRTQSTTADSMHSEHLSCTQVLQHDGAVVQDARQRCTGDLTPVPKTATYAVDTCTTSDTVALPYLSRCVHVHLWLVPLVLACPACQRLVLSLNLLQHEVVLPLLPLLNNVTQHTLL